MNCAQIINLIEEGLTLRHCMMLKYLQDVGTPVYVIDLIEGTGVNRRYVERAVNENPHMFRAINLSTRKAPGGTRPFTKGVGLTETASKIATRNLYGDDQSPLITLTQLSQLIEAGFTIRQCLLLRYLSENMSAARYHCIRADLPLTLKFLEQSPKTLPKYFERALLAPQKTLGASRARSAGIRITNAAKPFRDMLYTA